jgi:tetratricopeptide (TPR) repeat protein
MEEQVQIKGTLTPTDYFKFQTVVIKKRTGAYIWVSSTYLVILVSLIVFQTISRIEVDFLKRGNFVIPFIILAALPLFLYLVVFLSSKKSFLADKTMSKEQTYTFDKLGFRFIDEATNSYRLWTEINNYCESKTLFIIFISANRAHIVPKGWMQEEAKSALRSLLKNNIAPVNKRLYIRVKVILFVLIGSVIFVSVFVNFKKTDSGPDLFDTGYDKEVKKDYAGAIVDFTKAIQTHVQVAASYNHRGFVKGEMEDYLGELEDCSKALAIDTAYSDAMLNAGYAKYQLGDSLGGCAEFYQADQLGNTYAKKMIEDMCK